MLKFPVAELDSKPGLCPPPLPTPEVVVRGTGITLPTHTVPWETLGVRQKAGLVFSELRTKSWTRANNLKSHNKFVAELGQRETLVF